MDRLAWISVKSCRSKGELCTETGEESMQNRTDYAGLSFWDRLRQTAGQYRHAGEMAAAAVGGVVFSSAQILGGITPFGVALAAAVPEELFLPALFGALFGYLWFPAPGSTMEYAAAILLLGGVRWTLSTGSLWRRIPQAPAVLAGGCMLAGGLASAFALSGTPDRLLMAVAVSMLTAGSAWFFARSLVILRSRVASAYQEELGCLYVTFLLLTAGLARITALGISVGRVLASAGVLLFAVAGGPAGGAVMGVGAGLVALALGKESAFLMGSYAAGGLLAGAASRFGRIPTALCYLVVTALVSVTSPTARMLQISLAENLLACLIVLVLPARVVQFVQPAREGTAAQTSAERMALRMRMERFAQALREIGETTREVSRKLNSMHLCSVEDVWQHTLDTVCRKCPRRYRCWQSEFDQTMDAVNNCMLILRREGQLESGQIPAPLREVCRVPDELAAALTAGYVRYQAELGSRRKVSQIRGVVTDQFEGLAMLVEELSGRWESYCCRDSRLEEKAQSCLTAQGLDPGEICCSLDRENRLLMDCEINPLKLPRLDKTALALEMGELLGRELELPQVRTVGGHAYLSWQERAVYTVDWGSSQLTETGSKITGDAYRSLTTDTGRFVLILSDGMGTGGNAAVDSAMTSDLLRRLLEAGAGCDAALKIVNSALLLKSGEETLATADVAAVDLFTGRAEFYKAGAAPTFLVKNGRAGYVQSDSLPAGILEGAAFEKSSLTLREGDRLVLVSDGVTATGADWVKSQLEAGASSSPQQLAESLAKTARERQQPGREDDITVLVAELVRS